MVKNFFAFFLIVLSILTACGAETIETDDIQVLDAAEVIEIIETTDATNTNTASNLETIFPPIFSHTGGFYASDFELTITSKQDTTIRFTIDGSVPTVNSPIFNSPILIHSPAPTPENSPMSVGIGLGHYYRDWWWGPPALPLLYYNGMVVRARAFDDSGNASETVTHSFFVEREGRGVFNTRVISISMEPLHFIAPNVGMYHNFDSRTLRHMAYAEVFYPDGTLMFSQNAQARVSGNWSRRHPKKSLRLNFNRGDGVVINMPELIPNTRQSFYSPLEEVSSFKHITARISDWDTSTIRDTAAVLISEPLRPDIQNATFGAVFVNGEFWGMYCLREHRSDVQMAARYPGISPRSIVMLEHAPGAANNSQLLEPDDALWPFRDPSTNRLPSGHPLLSIQFDEGRSSFERQAYESWMEVLDAIRFLDMSVQENYEYVKTLVCMDNFIDYFLTQYHVDNTDWPGNNFITWRTEVYYPDIPAGDTRWRFFSHDFDNSMNEPFYDRTHHFTTTGAEHIAQPEWVLAQSRWAVEIWYSLFQNEAFRNTLAARYSTYTGTVFHPSRTNAIIDRLVEYRIPSIGSDFYRWRLFNRHADVNDWAFREGNRTGVGFIREVLNRRADYSIGHLRNYFNRTDRDNLGLGLDTTGFTNVRFTTNCEMGFFDIAGAQIRADLFDRGNIDDYAFSIGDFNANYIRGLPITVNAIALEGYEFLHFEVTGGVSGIFTENPIAITPLAGCGDSIIVNAVFTQVLW